MQFGLQVNPYVAGANGSQWESVARVARVVDESLFDSLWLYDHFLYEGGFSGHPFPEPVMECYTTLGAVAAITRRVRLGPLVIGVPYRNPAMLAKVATTLDLISHGRSILGIGAGWHQREHEAYGWGEFEPVPVRMRRLEEALKVIRALWTERPARFEGEFYRLEDVLEYPLPIQQPHPPILIGGNGERVTLRLVAQYGQFCNLSGEPEAVSRRLDVLREHCQRVGRPYEEITRSIYSTIILGQDEADVAAKRERWADFIPRGGALIGTPDQLIAMCREYAQAGCQYIIFRTPDWHEITSVQLFAEQVIPALAGD